MLAGILAVTAGTVVASWIAVLCGIRAPMEGELATMIEVARPRRLRLPVIVNSKSDSFAIFWHVQVVWLKVCALVLALSGTPALVTAKSLPRSSS